MYTAAVLGAPRTGKSTFLDHSTTGAFGVPAVIHVFRVDNAVFRIVDAAAADVLVLMFDLGAPAPSLFAAVIFARVSRE